MDLFELKKWKINDESFFFWKYAIKDDQIIEKSTMSDRQINLD